MTTLKTLSAEQIAKRNELSRISKQKKKANSLGLSLEEYQASLVKLSTLTPDERRLRRNKQSIDCKKRTKALKTGVVEPIVAVITNEIATVEPTADFTKAMHIKAIRMANLAKANAARVAKKLKATQAA